MEKIKEIFVATYQKFKEENIHKKIKNKQVKRNTKLISKEAI